ncbi:beta-mannosidase [Mesorhizobium sp. ASY16-5R]|uniref:beta-mannosidase n=1 Tax=Mesorhizobium sp. ASY16-5R TaxID=3445772 RepID=UPI003FA18311
MDAATPHTALDLSGIWRLESADGEFSADIALPGDVHSALFAAGIIADPYVARNELDVRWVADRDWLMTRDFDHVGPGGSDWYLDLEGLDTVAEVSLNGVAVLSSQNAFRRYRPDVTAILRPGRNTLSILICSATTAANELAARQAFPIPYAAQNCPIPNGNMLRKPACHFGWDWNLAIVPLGVYGRVGLRPMQRARVEHVQVAQDHLADGAVVVDVSVTLHGSKAATVPVAIRFAGEERHVEVKVAPGESRHVERFTVRDPKLWWPAGSGAQHLYPLEIVCDGETVRRNIGLRRVELLTEPDEAGSRFAFKVNGREIFCRGANWIPADALPSRAMPELTRKLLQAAADANMNMIRVWGGGFYEQDFFYDLCDELGLLAWQDFMFACNLYPSTPEFLAEVRAEVDYQVRRLGSHPSIALWCGDNELIGALNWFEESRKNRDRYLVNYDRLNRAIEVAMRAADQQALWWPSSPSPGKMSFGDAWHDDSSGDMHFWSVWHESRDFEHYRDVKPRFCSEFGFQSFPSLSVTRGFIESADDLNVVSPVMEWHQKNAGGNARIAETMMRYFRYPEGFGNFIYLSQIQQGVAIRTAVEYWRSLKPHCMGALYWQLNDTWPVASWSSLDHGGGWKALHYFARRFFSPVAVFLIPDETNAKVSVVAVNDGGAEVTVQADLHAVAVDGTVRSLGYLSGSAGPDVAATLGETPFATLGPDEFLFLDWKASDGSSGRSHFSPRRYKTHRLQPPGIGLKTTSDGNKVHLSLTAERPAFYVAVEAKAAGRFSDNVFDILPGETVELTFTPDDPAALSAVASDFIVRDLHSSYASRSI